MKKFILWMIRVFKLDITTEKVVEKIVERQVLPSNGEIEGDVYINGGLVIIKGGLKVFGNITTYADKGLIAGKKEDEE